MALDLRGVWKVGATLLTIHDSRPDGADEMHRYLVRYTPMDGTPRYRVKGTEDQVFIGVPYADESEIRNGKYLCGHYFQAVLPKRREYLQVIQGYIYEPHKRRMLYDDAYLLVRPWYGFKFTRHSA